MKLRFEPDLDYQQDAIAADRCRMRCGRRWRAAA